MSNETRAQRMQSRTPVDGANPVRPSYLEQATACVAQLLRGHPFDQGTTAATTSLQAVDPETQSSLTALSLTPSRLLLDTASLEPHVTPHRARPAGTASEGA